MSKTIWRNVLDSLTINPKYFDRDPIVYQKSSMEKLSKVRSIWNSEVNEDLVQIWKYCEMFIFQLKHPPIEHRIRSKRNCNILGNRNIRRGWFNTIFTSFNWNHTHQLWHIENFEGSNIKGNRHMTSGVGDNRQPLSSQSKKRSTSGAERSPSIFHPTSYKGKILIAFSSNNIPKVRNVERGRR